ncbi:PREDICTED: putative nuclease HARBI1 [Rhagoletis zephyria]|uniref:putative nuclease HARBI1 n=1 Tax=Rhagoletis zephyria TaxID=28612 RepID=UPI000811AA83|nr:PREDICTED: putative nuclease HARBI1 [Rhagoletis zephyria]
MLAAALIALATDQRNMLRVHRRHLRDATDPFHLPEARFEELFRFKKEAAIALLNEISPFMKNGERATFIPKALRMTGALHYFATGSFLRDVGQDFVCSLSKTMVCRSIKEVTYIIEEKLMCNYIKFPTTLEDQRIISLHILMCTFFSATGFLGCIDAIDCTHIKIKKPRADVESCYINRKGYFSKNVQLLCEYNLNILAGNARFGGSTHDAFIWENSKCKEFLERQYSRDANTSWLIGDSGYPLQPWLMTPFRNPETTGQTNFNFCHIRARNCMERLYNQQFCRGFQLERVDAGGLLIPHQQLPALIENPLYTLATKSTSAMKF